MTRLTFTNFKQNNDYQQTFHMTHYAGLPLHTWCQCITVVHTGLESGLELSTGTQFISRDHYSATVNIQQTRMKSACSRVCLS